MDGLLITDGLLLIMDELLIIMDGLLLIMVVLCMHAHSSYGSFVSTNVTSELIK